MKKKKIIMLIVVVVIIIAIVTIGNIAFDSLNIIDENSFYDLDEESSEIIDTNTITGKGSIVSFNIEELDTGYWDSIDEVYANDGDLVESNQKILKVSNSEATGVIYSTIKGKFFINEAGDSKKYLIYDLDNVGFEIEVNEKESSKLKIGQKVNVKINSLVDTLVGKVYYISKISNDGVIKAKIKLDYSDKIKFGYTAKAEILVDEEIDSSVQEFDTKNSFIKIGKTAITYKNVSSSEVEEPIIEDFSEMEEPEEYLNPEGDSFDEIEFNVEEISEYYNGYWNEYWNTYWKTFYETGETIPDVTD